MKKPSLSEIPSDNDSKANVFQWSLGIFVNVYDKLHYERILKNNEPYIQ